MIPFAVVGSERTVLVDGKPVRGRKNRWGVVNVENEAHCEFVHPLLSLDLSSSLTPALASSHLQDLIETTAQIHYEAFRSKQLLALKDAAAPRPSVAS
jgi:septin 3/9/12